MMCRLVLVAGFFLSSGGATRSCCPNGGPRSTREAPRNIMVMGVMPNPVLKTQFEDLQFV